MKESIIKTEDAERIAWRLKKDTDWRPGSLFEQAASAIRSLAVERDRLAAEVASLRITLGGTTFSGSIPEPIGCPTPGACAQVALIVKLMAALQNLVDAAKNTEANTSREMEESVSLLEKIQG